jgi:hypothetical protein
MTSEFWLQSKVESNDHNFHITVRVYKLRGKYFWHDDASLCDKFSGDEIGLVEEVVRQQYPNIHIERERIN